MATTTIAHTSQFLGGAADLYSAVLDYLGDWENEYDVEGIVSDYRTALNVVLAGFTNCTVFIQGEDILMDWEESDARSRVDQEAVQRIWGAVSYAFAPSQVSLIGLCTQNLLPTDSWPPSSEIIDAWPPSSEVRAGCPRVRADLGSMHPREDTTMAKGKPKGKIRKVVRTAVQNAILGRKTLDEM